jgi:3-oxoadipate enol-lactonase
VAASDGTPIYYETWGRADGEPVLMIQGLGADQRGWALQRVPFGRRFRCIAFDNRGVGRSGRPAAPYSLYQMADDAVAVLDAVGVDAAHVMGASMGGVIAQIVGVAHPARTRSLTLACTACTHHEWRRELLAEWADNVTRRGMSGLMPDGLTWLVGPRLRRRFGPWLNLLAPIVLQQDPAPFAAQVGAILDMADDMKDELKNIRVPTLVIVGSQDILTPVGDSEELADRIANAELVVIPGAAHGVMVEAPVAFNDAVMRFLSGLPAGNTDAGDAAASA